MRTTKILQKFNKKLGHPHRVPYLTLKEKITMLITLLLRVLLGI